MNTHPSTQLALRCSRAFRLAGGLAFAAALLTACGGGGGYDAVVPPGGGGSQTDPTVTTLAVNPLSADLKTLMITVAGTYLGQGFALTAPACSSLTLSTVAPNVSTDSTAYYRCAVPAAVAVDATAVRSRDNATLSTASFTPAATPSVTGAVAGEVPGGAPPGSPGTAKYAQKMTIAVTGDNVNQGLNVSSVACSGMALSVAPPFISTKSTAYYQCRVSATDLNQVSVALAADPDVSLFVPQFTVPVPQVTMTIRRDKTILGQLVLTLAAVETPHTVNNFLDYVNSGFYNGTVFHRVVVTPAPFVIQGGGFTSVTTGLETPKPTNPAIALEVNRGLSNVQWSLAMARSTAPNSATAQFFINLVNNAFLDPHPPTSGDPGIGYAVFGSVSAGVDVVNAIATSPCQQITGFSECVPNPNVAIDLAVQSR